MFHVPEKKRIMEGNLGSNKSDGNNGFFKMGPFVMIASDGMGWEHVSVSLPHRTLTWEEMCMIKDMFWDEEDCVVQYHPPKSDYINNHPYVLHLWRPINQEIPRPPSILVGIKNDH